MQVGRGGTGNASESPPIGGTSDPGDRRRRGPETGAGSTGQQDARGARRFFRLETRGRAPFFFRAAAAVAESPTRTPEDRHQRYPSSSPHRSTLRRRLSGPFRRIAIPAAEKKTGLPGDLPTRMALGWKGRRRAGRSTRRHPHVCTLATDAWPSTPRLSGATRWEDPATAAPDSPSPAKVRGECAVASK